MRVVWVQWWVGSPYLLQLLLLALVTGYRKSHQPSNHRQLQFPWTPSKQITTSTSYLGTSVDFKQDSQMDTMEQTESSVEGSYSSREALWGNTMITTMILFKEAKFKKLPRTRGEKEAINIWDAHVLLHRDIENDGVIGGTSCPPGDT